MQNLSYALIERIKAGAALWEVWLSDVDGVADVSPSHLAWMEWKDAMHKEFGAFCGYSEMARAMVDFKRGYS